MVLVKFALQTIFDGQEDTIQIAKLVYQVVECYGKEATNDTGVMLGKIRPQFWYYDVDSLSCLCWPLDLQFK